MLKLKRVILSLAAALVFMAAARADETEFKVNAPMIVFTGSYFNIEFILNANPDKDSFAAPDLSAFDILAGPVTSFSSFSHNINGKKSSGVKHRITYTLLPRNTGTFQIGAATIKADGKRYSTRPTTIEVSDNDSSDRQQSGGPGENRSPEAQAEGQIAPEDLLLRLSLSRSEVYTGEPIRASLKLYNRVNLADYGIQKMPAFDGFWTQQLEIDNTPHRETYNGKVYEVYTLAEYLLYPQQAGRLTVEPAELTAIVQVIVQSNTPFDPFFGGGREIFNVRRQLATARTVVNVKELPAGAPASFTGAVGRFLVEGAPSATELAANSAATYTLKVSGAGNLAFIQAPKLVLPSSFEQYQVKTTEQLRSTGSGTTGSKTFEYPFIARAEGDYTIAPAEFSYFDPEHARYVTVSTAAWTLDITPDASGTAAPQVIAGLSKEDVRLLGSDIRFIKLGKPALKAVAEPLLFSLYYFIALLCMAGAALGIHVVVTNRRRRNKNIALVRGKRANKVSVQRFRTAQKHMKADDKNAFYQEMLKALWGYMGDKFNIPVANLTKETVRDELQRRGVQADTARQFTDIISRCDEAQYSPAASTQMNEVYAEGISIVSQIESMIKK